MSRELEVEGDKVDRITLQYETHFSKKIGKLSDVKFKRIYNQLIEAKERCEAEGLDMIIDEIFNSVVPPKPRYVQGFDPGPKPMSRAFRLSEQRRKKAEDRAKSAEEKNEELTKQIEELRARQDRIEESIFQRIRTNVQAHFQKQD
ncbi:hypothetical protein FNV43_RR19096 [Rhamnella rubrinervis]|uniref:Uncharacterized protein n=1 Tax=Rhamnella rubrinervis TaxID=2594499 RepID=A0A8K0E0J4_9ROSA|nr:hypothetical protein FNV43_RR19096 [Rhamnella rubrinervis]